MNKIVIFKKCLPSKSVSSNVTIKVSQYAKIMMSDDQTLLSKDKVQFLKCGAVSQNMISVKL